ncbi:unnamed protein product [Ectocarpus sp. 6 AP-2014]
MEGLAACRHPRRQDLKATLARTRKQRQQRVSHKIRSLNQRKVVTPPKSLPTQNQQASTSVDAQLQPSQDPASRLQLERKRERRRQGIQLRPLRVVTCANRNRRRKVRVLGF